MTESTKEGIQLLNLTNHRYVLNEESLKGILLRDDIKDLPVVVVSVAGPFRAGKSFLLNFFLRYLKAPVETRNENGDWLGDENESVKGFSWRGGAERHTTGILMWSEPFISTLPSGDQVAILLMDTQGMYDSSSTVRDCSTIFALSTLISSVQIYNLKENIKEDDLQYLQLFTEYGKLVQNRGTKTFQVLQFLIRDWPYEYEYAYGRVGGEALLAKRLEGDEKMPAELREVRQHIRSCFDTVSCFLMPHPGRTVTKKDFKGKNSELDAEFKAAIKELVPSIFSPANLTPKLINGERVKCRDLYSYIETYVRFFSNDKTPTPVTIMQATAEASLLAAKQEARELYETRMERDFGADKLSAPSSVIHDKHGEALAAAQTAFRDKKKMTAKRDSDECLTQLTEELQKQLPKFLLMNSAKLAKTITEAKQAYESTVRNVHGASLLCLNPKDLDDLHNNSLTAALALFDGQRQRFSSVLDAERTNLIVDLKKKYEELVLLNDQHNRLYLAEAKLNFTVEIDRLLAENPPPPYYRFLYKYQDAKERAITSFKHKRNMYSSNSDDIYVRELEKNIDNRFNILKIIYSSTRN